MLAAAGVLAQRRRQRTPALSDAVGEAVGDAVGDAVGVAEHEPGTDRPVAAHPHAHGSGADDASGQ